MPSRELTYRFETEDAASAGMDRIEDSASSLEAGFRRLSEIEQMIARTAEDHAKRTLLQAEAQEELASAGIQTTAAIEAQIERYDRLLDFVQGDLVATQQLTERKQLLQRQLVTSTKAAGDFGIATGNTTQFLSNLSFSLNDSQQFAFGFDRGLQAVSNNLGVMIGQFQAVVAESGGFGRGLRTLTSSLAGPLGLSVAFSAVTTGMVLLQGAFKDTTEEAEETTSAIERQVSSLFKLSDALSGSFSVSSDEIEGRLRATREAIQQEEKLIEATREQIEKILTDRIGGAVAAFEVSEALNKQIAERETLIESLTAIQTELNSQLETQRATEAIITGGKKLGLEFEEEETKEKRRQLTELEKLTRERKELLGLLDEGNFAQLEQSVLLERELERLNQILETRRAIIGFQQDQNDIQDAFGSVLIDTQLDGAGVEEIENLFSENRIEEQVREFTERINANIQTIPQAIEAEARAAVVAADGVMTESIQNLIELNQGLETAIQNGLVNGSVRFGEALGDIASGAANFSALGSALLGTLGELATNVGKQMIGFGIAGLKLKELVANPVGAIIAGTALVALGRIASRRVNRTIQSAGRGGGSFSTSSFGSTTGAGGGSQFGLALGVPTTDELNERARREQDERLAELEQRTRITGRRYEAIDPSIGRRTGGVIEGRFELAPVVLPGGDILLSTREALEREVELGGSGELGR